MRLNPVVPPSNLEQRDRLVLDHLALVRTLASRLSRRLPSHVDGSELVGVGVMGLVEAAGRYEPLTGVPFDAFARQRIQGAMLDALRSLDRAPRSVRRQQRELEAVLMRLRQSLGREPETEEIAATLEITLDQYGTLLERLHAAEVATVGRADQHGSLLDVALDASDGPHAQLERRELRRLLARGLAELPERERHVLALCYDEELTLAEVGTVLGVGPSRVSQLRTQAITRLRSMMRSHLEPAEGDRA